MSDPRFSWASRGLNSVVPREKRHAQRAELRARILRALAAAGDAGLESGDLCDELATRAKRSEVQAETKRAGADGLTVYESRCKGHSPRWYITDAGRAAAGRDSFESAKLTTGEFNEP